MILCKLKFNFLFGDYFRIGITGQGHEIYRPELALLYFPTIGKDGKLVSLQMKPVRIEGFKLNHATKEQSGWLAETLDRETSKLYFAADSSTRGRKQPRIVCNDDGSLIELKL